MVSTSQNKDVAHYFEDAAELQQSSNKLAELAQLSATMLSGNKFLSQSSKQTQW